MHATYTERKAKLIAKYLVSISTCTKQKENSIEVGWEFMTGIRSSAPRPSHRQCHFHTEFICTVPICMFIRQWKQFFNCVNGLAQCEIRPRAPGFRPKWINISSSIQCSDCCHGWNFIVFCALLRCIFHVLFLVCLQFDQVKHRQFGSVENKQRLACHRRIRSKSINKNIIDVMLWVWACVFRTVIYGLPNDIWPNFQFHNWLLKIWKITSKQTFSFWSGQESHVQCTLNSPFINCFHRPYI